MNVKDVKGDKLISPAQEAHNREIMDELIPFFGYDYESTKRIQNDMFLRTELDDILGLGDDRRRFFEIDVPIEPEDDKNYNKYVNYLYENRLAFYRKATRNDKLTMRDIEKLWEKEYAFDYVRSTVAYEMGLIEDKPKPNERLSEKDVKALEAIRECDKLIEQWTKYDTFFTGKMRNGQRLFRTLIKQGFDAKKLEEFTTNKASHTSVYMCISKNPVDLLVAATNQSFTSCISLDSDYEEAFYLTLPTFFIDPNRFIVFLCKKKDKLLNKYSFNLKNKTNAYIYTFPYIYRTFGMYGATNDLHFVRWYPRDTMSSQVDLAINKVYDKRFFPVWEMPRSKWKFTVPSILASECIPLPYLDGHEYDSGSKFFLPLTKGEGHAPMHGYYWYSGFQGILDKGIEPAFKENQERDDY